MKLTAGAQLVIYANKGSNKSTFVYLSIFARMYVCAETLNESRATSQSSSLCFLLYV